MVLIYQIVIYICSLACTSYNGVQSTDEKESKKEEKDEESSESVRFDDGEYPEDFPWPVLEEWEAKSFVTRLVEGEKNWNGKFMFEQDA
ncbi:hypothetical protein [Sporosarcina sp. G11-34]|uniref:hypothetical protein n=1 Tax=Sporosarcina sp. G11-34 TaxID=2849605 RepID=UPI0022A9C2A1|nr:hypothetical protein [Sporosarcina sp. G11-34]MCZ2259141.1 hypothetical protein [Sporosarcina sp. G11-34]